MQKHRVCKEMLLLAMKKNPTFELLHNTQNAGFFLKLLYDVTGILPSLLMLWRYRLLYVPEK